MASRPRPVQINTWEARYFDINENNVIALIEKAAELGIERFVLDDGWFAGRRSDRSSLGDWWVDKDKFPNGLTPLIQTCHRNYMTFGLWIEPEMVSPDSELYRAHPDWVPSSTKTMSRFSHDISKCSISAELRCLIIY